MFSFLFILYYFIIAFYSFSPLSTKLKYHGNNCFPFANFRCIKINVKMWFSIRCCSSTASLRDKVRTKDNRSSLYHPVLSCYKVTFPLCWITTDTKVYESPRFNSAVKPCDRLLDDVNPPLISYILEEQKDLSSYFRTSVVPSNINIAIVNESRTITHVYTMTVVLSRFLCFGLSNFPNLSTLRKRTPPARIG